MMGVDEDSRAAAVGADHLHNAAILLLRETASAVAGRNAHAEHADLPQAAHHVVGNQRFAVDAGGVDVIAGVLADLVDRASRGGFQFRWERGIRNDRLATEAAEEEILCEPGLLGTGKEEFFRLLDLLAAKFGLGGGHRRDLLRWTQLD